MTKLAALVSVTMLVSPSGRSSACVLRVPSEYSTIQDGVNAAVDGDTVLVADGTYAGDGNRDLDFGGANIVAMSEHGPEVTIIDCEGSQQDPHRGFYFHSDEQSDAVVQGFTITNGWVTNFGGGIRCTSSSPTITGNIIAGNGGELAGGGIRSDGWSSPTIVGNTIIGNTYAGISCYWSSPTIVNNLIAGNSSSNGGGVICDNSSPVMAGNTITGNTVIWSGGGILCINFSSPVVRNSILWNDSAVTGSEIWLDETCGITITYSDLEGGWSGEGNIDADPLFVTGPLGDYYLSQIAAGQAEQSPCVDAGDPGSSVPDGTTRTDEEPDVSPVDMGYHYPIGGVGLSREEKEEDLELPQHLTQSYPNPFSSTTTIAYSLLASSTVRLAVYDVRGALVRTLTSGTVPPGWHEVVWDGRDERGRKVGSGVYFCHLEAGDRRETTRMVLLR